MAPIDPSASLVSVARRYYVQILVRTRGEDAQEVRCTRACIWDVGNPKCGVRHRTPHLERTYAGVWVRRIREFKSGEDLDILEDGSHRERTRHEEV